MSTTAMKFVDLVKDGVVTERATEYDGRNNLLIVSGISSNGTLKFDVSVDGGTTWVEDSSLEFTADGVKVLHNAPAILKAKLSDVADTTNLKVQLGY